jgi:hypothetical protein
VVGRDARGTARQITRLAVVRELDRPVAKGADLRRRDILGLRPPHVARRARAATGFGVERVIEALDAKREALADALQVGGAEQAATHDVPSRAELAALEVEVRLERIRGELLRCGGSLHTQQRGVIELRIEAAVEAALHVDAAHEQRFVVPVVRAELIRARLACGESHVVDQRKLLSEVLVEVEAGALEGVE